MHLRTQSRAPRVEPKHPPGCKMDRRLSSHTASQGNRFVSARMRCGWMVGKTLPLSDYGRVARHSPRVLRWKAPNVERRIRKVATIRWDFPQGHADERSAQCWDRIPGL